MYRNEELNISSPIYWKAQLIGTRKKTGSQSRKLRNVGKFHKRRNLAPKKRISPFLQIWISHHPNNSCGSRSLCDHFFLGSTLESSHFFGGKETTRSCHHQIFLSSFNWWPFGKSPFRCYNGFVHLGESDQIWLVLGLYHVNENDRHLKFNQFSWWQVLLVERCARSSRRVDIAGIAEHHHGERVLSCSSYCGTRMDSLQVERRRRQRHDMLFNLL